MATGSEFVVFGLVAGSYFNFSGSEFKHSLYFFLLFQFFILLITWICSLGMTPCAILIERVISHI
jgi:hypothetical protein